MIYSTTDTKAAGPIIKGFEALYPGVKVEYNDMNSTELYNRYISEQAAGGSSGDIVWSSSMDSALKLATDYALQYKSPEIAKLPAWAVWKDSAYGTTSVSYTHLDVYKRQAISCPKPTPACRWSRSRASAARSSAPIPCSISPRPNRPR